MTKEENQKDAKKYWPLPQDLESLHHAVIEYAVRVQTAAGVKHKKTSEGSITHTALFTLHRSAIIAHRSTRSVCGAGWTPTAPILIRTLLDILASSYAIVANSENAEFMAFKFVGSYFIQAISDPDTSSELRKMYRGQLDSWRQQMRKGDLKRVDELIANFKPQAYWYRPEFRSPGTIIKDCMPRFSPMYRHFSGSVHGSFIGSFLFDDSPDKADINPQEHPIKTRNAILATSRLLLDISWARGTFEGVTDDSEYNLIVKTMILPQQDKIMGP